MNARAFILEDDAAPCVRCGVNSRMIERETGQRRHIYLAGVFGCDRPETMHHHPDLRPAQAIRQIAATPRQTPAAAAGASVFVHAPQETAYRARVAVLDAMDPADDSDDTVNKAARALRIVEAMTDDPEGDLKRDGPFAPRKYGTSSPFWTAKLPPIDPPLVAFAGWGTFEAPTTYTGPAAVLDRNAGHPSAMSSLRVAHGPLQHTGPLPNAKHPGYYLTVAHPWTRTDLPNPLPGREIGERAWVTAERMRLLEDLVTLGCWSQATILDSWTAEKECSLADLAQLIKHLRAHVIQRWGKESPQWEAIKEASNNKLIQILMGSAKHGAPWTDRTWHTRCRRTDWGHALHDKAAANLYRVAVKLVRADIPVLAMRHMDEILIPADLVDYATDHEAIRPDETGLTFGTFKTKTVEMWGS